MKFSYKTKGTCSQQIDLEINGDIITDITFYGGCNGNLKAISKLVDGWSAEQIAEKCSGIKCGFKNTSCSDQLAHAVLAAKEAAKAEK